MFKTGYGPVLTIICKYNGNQMLCQSQTCVNYFAVKSQSIKTCATIILFFIFVLLRKGEFSTKVNTLSFIDIGHKIWNNEYVFPLPNAFVINFSA